MTSHAQPRKKENAHKQRKQGNRSTYIVTLEVSPLLWSNINNINIWLTRGWSLINVSSGMVRFRTSQVRFHVSRNCWPFDFCTYGYKTSLIQCLHWSHLGHFRRNHSYLHSDWLMNPGYSTHPTTCHNLIGCHMKWVLWWTVTTQSVT